MGKVSTDKIKELRTITGAGVLDCKQALIETKGDIKTAIGALRKKGLAKLDKKSTRATNEGLIDSYIHTGGKIGVLVEVNCETDFVAQNKEFKEFVHNLAIHVAAANPTYISRDEVPSDVIKKEEEIYIAQAKEQGKPKEIATKIAEGKLEKFFEAECLFEQAYVKNPDITIKDYFGEVATKIGENIVIKRFVRLRIGEE